MGSVESAGPPLCCERQGPWTVLILQPDIRSCDDNQRECGPNDCAIGIITFSSGAIGEPEFDFLQRYLPAYTKSRLVTYK